ncbi:MAG: GAF domain-containing protein [Candidatus Zixiibacteriota bacterium]
MKKRIIFKKLSSLVESGKERDEVLKEVVALLKNNFSYYNWVGIYLMEGEELVLGPFLGKPSPHTRITLDKGICGAAAKGKKTIIVSDVSKDTRYLTCAPETKSEIVVPIMKGDKPIGEIDVDSDTKAAFKRSDKDILERISLTLSTLF